MAHSAKKSVLLMDDDALVLQTLTRLLEKEGYAVQAFQDPREAVQAAVCDNFDLVIADIRMPHLDGFQALRYIREVRSQNKKEIPPEILITGYAKEYQEEMKKAKPHAVVFKPFDLREFIQVVRQALDNQL